MLQKRKKEVNERARGGFFLFGRAVILFYCNVFGQIMLN
jgi:hypothetical protein